MSISSNSIVHYTRKFDTLKQIILESMFRLKYCSEKIVFNKHNDDYFEIAVPMISFCDIPFSSITNHVKEYGNYGIGLKKEWAIKNKLNPVVYLENNSILTDSISELFNYIYDPNNLDGNVHNEWEYAFKNYNSMLCFIKSYSGNIKIVKDNRYIKDYRFYDEREWRYVCVNNPELEPIVLTENYRSSKEELNKKAFSVSLSFSSDDLSYIILEKQSQIDKFISFIDDKTAFNSREICAKIITVEQIQNDF